MTATIHSIKRSAGVAGQVQYTAVVEYEGEGKSTVSFVGSVYGPPIVMIAPTQHQIFVSNPERFGPFGEQWVRNFFQEA
jgi:hypothetical protein